MESQGKLGGNRRDRHRIWRIPGGLRSRGIAPVCLGVWLGGKSDEFRQR